MTIDSDISEVEARRLLSVADDDPRSVDRRNFLRLVGMGLGAGALAGGLDELVRVGLVPDSIAEAATPIGAADGVLVFVGLDGGLDGLNTVVPYADGNYYTQHGSLALPASSLHILDPAVGLHPSLSYVKSLYDLGEVAVVQGIGYPSPSFSHFSSMAAWMYGGTAAGVPSSGWVGRWLDGFASADLFRAVAVGSALPLTMKGVSRRGTAVPSWGLGFGAGTTVYDQRMHTALRSFGSASAGRGAWHDVIAATVGNVVDVGQAVGPSYSRPLPDSDLVRKLTLAARMVNADIGIRVIDTATGGFDTHANQPATLASLLQQLDDGLKAFFTSLDDRFRSRVTVVVHSEFGRPSWANDSQGTDHGAASNSFVIGRGVQGGLLGAQPPLAGLGRWDRMAYQVDLRQMYAGILDGWLGGGSSTVLGGTYSALPLFRSTPGAGVATGVVPTSALGDYVPLAPARLYDSRLAPRRLPLGAGAAGEVQVTGAGGVPATGVTAVALRVGAATATAATSLTAWPTGVARPVAPVVQATAAASTSALAITKIGSSGRVNVFNDLGDAQATVDVIGYYRSTAAGRTIAVNPGRALDTRTGTGGKTGTFAANTTFDVTIRGVAGVPKTATAALVSLTAFGPSAATALTVYQTGAARPALATLPVAASRTATTTTLVPLSSTGKVTVHNAAGTTHVVVDVLAYVGSATNGRHFPLPSARLLDTRTDATLLFSAGTVRSVAVLGKGGVPATGVSGVLLELTVVGPSADTTVTAWAAGATRPAGATLSTGTAADATVLAMVKVGTGGAVQVHNSAGTANVVVDVVGYLT
ncbi:MAG: DUF1501 domain-containing protein [Ilumatobacteraceae bacterium]